MGVCGWFTLPVGTQVNVGRLDENTMTIPDSEISGNHVSMRWEASGPAWYVMDLGSLNGTMLNDHIISTSNRRPGKAFRLSSDDILQLGSRTKLKVTCLPHEMSQVGRPSLVTRCARCGARCGMRPRRSATPTEAACMLSGCGGNAMPWVGVRAGSLH